MRRLPAQLPGINDDVCHISTIAEEKGADARFSHSYAPPGRQKGSDAPAPERAPEFDRMRRMYRMGRDADFGSLFRRGRRHESECFRIVYLPVRRGHARFAFIVSRAVDTRASARHRLERFGRSWIESHRTVLTLAYDIAIVFKKSAGTASRSALSDEFERAFARLAMRDDRYARVSTNRLS